MSAQRHSRYDDPLIISLVIDALAVVEDFFPQVVEEKDGKVSRFQEQLEQRFANSLHKHGIGGRNVPSIT